MIVIKKSFRASARCLYRSLTLALFPFLGSGTTGAATPAPERPPANAAELFNETNIWTVHLRFEPDQWAAIEPKGGEGGFFGRPPGGPGGRPGGPGGPGGGMFGPAMLLAPSFLKEGDKNQDGKLSKDEFSALGEKWFAAWDKDKTGTLDGEKVRTGLNTTLVMPPFGGPGPGGPGGPGGRPGGMNLQGAEGKRNGLASAAGVEFKYVHASLDFGGQTFKDVAVRYKGNGTFMQSRESMKHSLKIDLNKYTKGQKVAGITRLNLHNNVTDASWMNEPLAHRLFRDAGVPAPRSTYARVYVSVPGKFEKKYVGLYSIIEDPDKHFLKKMLNNDTGALLKPVTPNLFSDLGADWKGYNQTYDPKTTLTDQQKKRIIDFCKFVANANDAEFSSKIGEYLDMEEFANFMAVTVWLANLDSILDMGQNFYVYLNGKTDKFQFIPWDLDHSFGQFGMRGSQEQRENLSIQHPWAGENRFLQRMFNVSTFKKLYVSDLDRVSNTLAKPARFAAQVDRIAAAIRPAVQEEPTNMLASVNSPRVQEESADKLVNFDKAVAGETISGGGPGGPGSFMRPGKPIKAFVKARAQSVSEQLAGKTQGEMLPEFGFGGGRGGPGGPGGPGGFGPGNFLGGTFMTALDSSKDGTISHEEFARGFGKWFESWNADKTGILTDEQLRKGINQDLSPFPGGPPNGPDFRPPPSAR